MSLRAEDHLLEFFKCEVKRIRLAVNKGFSANSGAGAGVGVCARVDV